MRAVIVDGANVVGSRPDGWWRDRAAAAERLHTGITAAELADAVIVLVLEGRAKRGQPVGQVGRVETVHAPGSGDDEIVEQVQARASTGDDVVVVTADRGLRERVAAAGGSVVGPSWLLSRIPD